MRIAAIDMGSNSFHMVIVESVAGAFHLIEQEKEMVRLGERTLSRGRLSADAMRRAVEGFISRDAIGALSPNKSSAISTENAPSCEE